MTCRRAACVLMLVCFAAGCGGGLNDAPDTAPVKGKITRNGQPLAGVSVVYQPIDVPEGKNNPSQGLTNAAGEYELSLNRNVMGAVIGKHKVRLNKDTKESTDEDGNRLKNPVIIPDEYNSQTLLEIEVPATGLTGGASDFDLDF